MSDLLINVRQISQYPLRAAANGTEMLLVQPGGVGNPYQSVSANTLLSTALNTPAGSLGVGVTVPANSAGGLLASNVTTPNGCTTGWNWYATATGEAYLNAGPAAVTCFDGPSQTFEWATAVPGSAGQAIAAWTQLLNLSHAGGAIFAGTVTCQPATAPTMAATLAQLNAAVAAAVTSWNGRTGPVVMTLADIVSTGGAPNASPGLTGAPTAPSPPPGDSSTRLATTAFVAQSLAAGTVASFNGRIGVVTLSLADVEAAGGAPIASPAFTGAPTTITPAHGDASTLIADTAFVAANTVNSFNGRQGPVVLALSDITGVGGAPLLSPSFSGVPNAPTANPGTSTSQLATTAFVQAAVTAATTGVVSWNGRQGVVTLQSTDITGAGGALLASPAFTGTPTAPTAANGTATTQLASCQFVMNEVAAIGAGVVSFNTRSGNVVLELPDVTGVGGAPIASPNFSGIPTAATAAPGTSTTQLATTAFVTAAVNASVVSFNGRTGAVTLTNNDISAAGGLANPSAIMTGTPTAPTAPPATNTTQLATTQFVTAAVSAITGIVVATTAPASPNQGQGWFDSTKAQLFIWSGLQWIIAVNPPLPDLSGYAQLVGANFTGSVTLQGGPVIPSTAVPPVGLSSTALLLPLGGTNQAGNVAWNSYFDGTNWRAVAAGYGATLTAQSANGAVVLSNRSSAAAGAAFATARNWSFDQAGNTILPSSVAVPAGSSLAMLSAQSTLLTLGGNHYWNLYSDGTNTHAIAAGPGGAIGFASPGIMYLTSYPSVAAGAVIGTGVGLAIGTSNGAGTSVSGQGFQYSVSGSTHYNAFGWDGQGIQGWVDGVYMTYVVRSDPSVAGGTTPVFNTLLNGASSQMYAYYSGGSVAWGIAFSDRRLKQNIVPAGDALAAVNAMKVYTADLTNPFPGATMQHWRWSLIADEVEAVVPEAFIAAPDANGYQSIRELPLIAMLTKAVQQLAAKVAILEGAHP